MRALMRSLLDAIIFLTGDIVSLVVQGAGGGIASAAKTYELADNGAHIMLGGIVFQLSESYSPLRSSLP